MELPKYKMEQYVVPDLADVIHIECCGEQVPDMQAECVGSRDRVGGGYHRTESTNINVMDEVATTGASGTDVAVPAHVFRNFLEEVHLENVRASHSTLRGRLWCTCYNLLSCVGGCTDEVTMFCCAATCWW